MSLISSIVELFKSPPEGPVFDLGDLVHENGRYFHHVEAATALLRSVLWNRDRPLVVRDDEEVNPSGLLSDIKWKHMACIRGWTDDEFIPKIRDYSAFFLTGPVRHERLSEDVHVYRCGELEAARRNLDLADRHGKNLTDIIRYFICDTRSQFRQRDALRDDLGGDCTTREMVEWYVGGLRIVRRNIERIHDNISKVIEFAIARKNAISMG